MGREIRRVPPDWKHPKSTKHEGYKPLFDETFEDALANWEKERAEFEAKGATLANGKKYEGTFEDWHGERPTPEGYRPDFGDRATAYQMYETVSEGTPVSPVFATKVELIAWLMGKGHSRKAAEKFVELGWAPSMIFSPATGCRTGVDAFDDTPGPGPAPFRS